MIPLQVLSQGSDCQSQLVLGSREALGYFDKALSKK
jgi:hypothetical protein